MKSKANECYDPLCEKHRGQLAEQPKQDRRFSQGMSRTRMSKKEWEGFLSTDTDKPKSGDAEWTAETVQKISALAPEGKSLEAIAKQHDAEVEDWRRRRVAFWTGRALKCNELYGKLQQQLAEAKELIAEMSEYYCTSANVRGKVNAFLNNKMKGTNEP